jgi:phytoene/squalene synthetase
MIRIEDFEDRLIRSARQGYAVDREFLGQTRSVIRECVEKTWPLYTKGSALLEKLTARSRPIVWLLAEGGQRVLRMIEMWNYETALHRPVLSKPVKLWLISKAWWSARRAPSNAQRETQA